MSKIKVLAIDIGHNVRFDGGAVGIKKEDVLNLAVGTRLLERLKNTNIKIINCTPDTASSTKDALQRRCTVANNGNADLFVSIHHNASPGGYGCEALCIRGGLAEATGKIILEEITNLGFRNRGIKERRDLYVIKNTSMPALIVECAFVDSPADMNGYDPIAMGDAIFRGLVHALNLLDTPTTPPATQDEYYVALPGDTLWGISRRFNTTVDMLVSMNGIKDKNLIRVGQKLKVK
ncbi:MAG: N-acetylmuramoyl-L-alanine amidase [Clostridium sp.]